MPPRLFKKRRILDGTESFYLTDGSRVVYAKDKENSHFRIGDSVESLKYGGKEYRYCGEMGAYTAEYTKYGMEDVYKRQA